VAAGETGRRGDNETGRKGDRETGRQGEKLTVIIGLIQKGCSLND